MPAFLRSTIISDTTPTIIPATAKSMEITLIIGIQLPKSATPERTKDTIPVGLPSFSGFFSTISSLLSMKNTLSKIK